MEDLKKLKIGFLYNVRHLYPDPKNPQSFVEADFDDADTIDWIIKHLKEIVSEVYPVEANEDAYQNLKNLKEKIDLVFNFACGFKGKDRTAQLPAIMEMLGIAYTGSSPLTQALILNKAKTKEIFKAYGISHLDYQVFTSSGEELKPELNFPLIVKPVAQGSSAGITNDSVVENVDDLKKQVTLVVDTFHAPALVEPYLEGREFSIGLLGNEPQVLPIIEPDHTKLPQDLRPIDSLEVKWVFEEEGGGDYLKCPAEIDDDLKNKIDKIALDVWRALDIYDFCRIDMRCDQDTNIYVLEVNSPAGLIPPEVSMTSYLPLAARVAGIDYPSLLAQIINSARVRYKIPGNK